MLNFQHSRADSQKSKMNSDTKRIMNYETENKIRGRKTKRRRKKHQFHFQDVPYD